MVAAPLRGLLAMVLVLLTLGVGGCGRERPAPGSSAAAPNAGTAPAGRLQEVAPPPLVRQLAERLEEREPQLAILAPADGALLPAGPWRLALQLSDWPLADAGPLGLGPHLVVQVDGEIVRRLGQPGDLDDLTLPELAPGSHRITVYAARPWGEAVKAPGASRQIRVHRLAANPQQLPAPGSAQLVLASPTGLAQAEPVLIDWLLFDAPLQNLREGDGSWRLRVTLNGDSFLVDRHAPLWLRGLGEGSNALQLELLDGRGEPLNGAFNSLVREVPIRPGPRPGWLRSSLTPLDLDQLSGLAPVPEADGAALGPAVDEPGDGSKPSPDNMPDPEPEAGASAPAEGPGPAAGAQSEATDPPLAPESAEGPAAATAAAGGGEGAAATVAPAASDVGPETAPDGEGGDPQVPAPLAPAPAADQPPAPADLQAGSLAAAPGPGSPAAAAEPAPQAPQPAAAPPAPPLAGEERIATSSDLAGSARQLVNADGSLIQPQRPGPLARLREKLQR